MLKPNISCSESRGLDAQTHPCVEEFVHGLHWRASANGSQPRQGWNQTLPILLGIKGQILPSVTLIRIQHNSSESSESGLIYCKVTGWELGSGTGDASVALNRCEGMKPSPLPPCVCAAERRADSTNEVFAGQDWVTWKGELSPHKQNGKCCFGEHLSEKKRGPSPPTAITACDVYSPSSLCSTE